MNRYKVLTKPVGKALPQLKDRFRGDMIETNQRLENGFCRLHVIGKYGKRPSKKRYKRMIKKKYGRGVDIIVLEWRPEVYKDAGLPVYGLGLAWKVEERVSSREGEA